MVCPNCKSTDIANIQGQNYCLNCGQIVVETEKQPAPPALDADMVAKIAATPLKIVDNLSLHARVRDKQSVGAKPDKPTAVPMDKKVSHAAASIVHTKRRRIDSAHVTKPSREQINHSWHAPFAVVCALVTISIFASILVIGPHPLLTLADWAINHPLPGWNHMNLGRALVVVGVLWLVYCLNTLTTAAFYTQKSLRARGRTPSDEAVIAAAYASFGATLLLDAAMSVIWLFVATFAIEVAWYVAAMLHPSLSSQPYLWAGLVFVVIVVWGSLYAARNLAVANIVLTAQKPRSALRIAWQLLRRHALDVSSGLITGAALVILFEIPALAIWLWLRLVPGSSSLREPLTAVWLVMIGLGLYLVVTYINQFWLHLYLEIAGSLPPAIAAKLVQGRVSPRPSATRTVIALSGVVAVGLVLYGLWTSGLAASLPVALHSWIIR